MYSLRPLCPTSRGCAGPGAVQTLVKIEPDPGDTKKFGEAVAVSCDYAIVGLSETPSPGQSRKGAVQFFGKIGLEGWRSLATFTSDFEVPDAFDSFGLNRRHFSSHRPDGQ